MFKPVNRYIQIKIEEKPAQAASGIVLPADFKPMEERHGTAIVVSYAEDVRFKEDLVSFPTIIIDKSMIEEITINNEKISIVLDNYVVGIIK